MKTYYNPKLKERSKKLRNNATYAERLLWKHLKNKQILGCQFTRQKPIANYIVDFYCSNLELVIEIDGISHNEKKEYDTKRINKLKGIGLKVIRFDGFYIINHINEALIIITEKDREIERTTTP